MRNEVTISGMLVCYDNQFEILCARDSGRIDRLFIYSTDDLTDLEGLNVTVHGRIESSKKKPLVIKSYYIHESIDIGLNFVELEGRVCKVSDIRTTSQNRIVRTVILAVGNGNYIPCLLWNSHARRSADLRIGEKIAIRGRIQSRDFIKRVLDTTLDKTTYEVTVMEIL